MRKKILSLSIAAVLTTVTSSSVMAFDANGTRDNHTDGEILVQGDAKKAAYQGNLLPLSGTSPLAVNLHPPVPSIPALALSKNGRGDALIFPLFTQADDWGGEFIVRNTNKDRAIVAKVAVYAKEDSEEVLDFNIYLSAADVVRFTIKNGKLTSHDGSVLRVVPDPSASFDSNITKSKFASATSPFERELKTKTGYIIVYGMAEAITDADDTDLSNMSYHDDHARLVINYRRELDVCRSGWRKGHREAMQNGTYIRKTKYSNDENFSIPAPNQSVDCLSTKKYDSKLGKAKDIREAAEELKSEANTLKVLSATSKITTAMGNVEAIEIASKALKEAINVFNKASDNIDLSDVAIATVSAPFYVEANKKITSAKAELAKAESERANIPAEILTNTKDGAKNALAGSKEIANSLLLVARDMVDFSTIMVDAIVKDIEDAAKDKSDISPKAGSFFGDVDPNLTGTVRIYNSVGGARDMVLPATAINNFTVGNKIIWAEGEIAALQDRRIVGDKDEDKDLDTSERVNEGWARYDEVGIRKDAEAFLVKNTAYTFSANSLKAAVTSVANQLIVTQPYKRPLVQLGNDDGYWRNTSSGFGGFSVVYHLFDEDENMSDIGYTESPHDSGIDIQPDELATLADLEKSTNYNGKNGFALLKFTNEDGDSALPAIITQMIGTVVEDKSAGSLIPQLNWIYSQTNEPK